jgi:parvulin-like peptidyl-prolyl isomerase
MKKLLICLFGERGADRDSALALLPCALPVLLSVLLIALGSAGCARKAVAKVNGQLIREADLIDRLKRSQMATATLNEMILETVIEQEAQRKGAKVSKGELDEAVREQEDEMGPRWREMMERMGQTEHELRRTTRINLILGKLYIPESQLREHFRTNGSNYDRPARAVYKQIVLRSKEEAEQVRQDILDKRVSFDDAVKSRSIDPVSQVSGGVIGPYPLLPKKRDELGYELTSALSKLPIKQVSKPVQTLAGAGNYMLIQVVSREPAQKATPENSRFRAMSDLIRMRASEIYPKVLDLQAKASLEILDSRYRSLEEQYKILRERRPSLQPERPTVELKAPTPAPAPPKQREQKEKSR